VAEAGLLGTPLVNVALPCPVRGERASQTPLFKVSVLPLRVVVMQASPVKLPEPENPSISKVKVL